MVPVWGVAVHYASVSAMGRKRTFPLRPRLATFGRRRKGRFWRFQARKRTQPWQPRNDVDGSRGASCDLMFGGFLVSGLVVRGRRLARLPAATTDLTSISQQRTSTCAEAFAVVVMCGRC